MGRTWKSAVLAVVFGPAAICCGTPIPIVTNIAPHGLARSFRAMPELNRGQPVSPGEPASTDTHRERAEMASNASMIVAYVTVLELLLAVISAAGCLLLLGLAGFFVNRQKRSPRDGVPATESSGTLVFVPARRFPVSPAATGSQPSVR